MFRSKDRICDDDDDDKPQMGDDTPESLSHRVSIGTFMYVVP